MYLTVIDCWKNRGYHILHTFIVWRSIDCTRDSDQRMLKNFSSLRVATFDLFLGEPPGLWLKICPLWPRRLQDQSRKRGNRKNIVEMSSHVASEECLKCSLVNRQHTSVFAVCDIKYETYLVTGSVNSVRRDCNKPHLICLRSKKMSDASTIMKTNGPSGLFISGHL